MRMSGNASWGVQKLVKEFEKQKLLVSLFAFDFIMLYA